MKQVILAVLLASVFSAQAVDFSDMADVVSVQPLTRQVSETRQSCTTEVVQEQVISGGYQQPQQKSYAGPIVGGVTGAIIGNQVGRGDGKTAATAIGAAVGAMVGDSMSNNQPQYQQQPQVQSRNVQRCQPYTTTHTVSDGYDVTYKYNGKIGRTTTQYYPGQQIRVGITAQ